MKLICVCVTRNRGTGSKSDGSSFLINALNSYEETVGIDAKLVVIDDASSDDTFDLITHWPSTDGPGSCTPIIMVHAIHLGIAGSMNKFILPDLHDDDIVVRFDDDILFNCPGWGQRILDTFAAAPPEMVSLGGRQIDPRGWIICFGDRLIGPVYRHHFSQYHPDSMAGSDDIGELFPVHSVMGAFGAFRVSALKAIGGYDPRFAKLRCETEDVHCSFLARGWHAGVRFGLDITHWSDPTYEHDAPDKAWGCEGLNETWFHKWGFHRTGLTGANAFDPQLAINRAAQILKGNKFRLIERLTDPDFDEIPGMTGRYTRFILPPAERTSPPETSRPLEHVI